jgi:hypothetical protein
MQEFPWFLKVAIRIFLTAAIVIGLWECRRERDEAICTIETYNLLKALSRAKLDAPASGYIVDRTAAVSKEERRVIFMHPPSSAEFPPVQVYPDSVLTFAIGIQDEAWGKNGDGVEFKVHVRGAGSAQNKVFILYSRYIDPKHNPEDRHWIGVRIPLRRFTGKAIQLMLSTAPGPANNTDFDWAVWGEPQILLR